MAGMESASTPTVILASGSPRRRQLLAEAGVAFTVRVSQVDESLDPDLEKDPPRAVLALAERKAGAVARRVAAEGAPGPVAVVGSDTMVVCGGDVFGKPRDEADAARMLRRLSGRTHQVMTAVSVWLVEAGEASSRGFVDVTDVAFRPLADDEIADYLRRGESLDKAGAYAIQGAGAGLVDHIEGSLDTVVGLPVRRLLEEFPELAPSM